MKILNNDKGKIMRIYNAKILVYLLTSMLFAAAIPGESSAQTGISFSWYLIRDDNAFKSRNEYQELINTTSLMLSRSYSFNDFALQGFYGIDVSAFSEYSDQKNHAHQLGLFGRKMSGSFITDIGLYTQLRRNEAQYIFYNTDNYSFFLKTEFQPELNQVYSLGITYLKTNFNEFTDLNNTSYKFYGSFQRFFQSRMSISGEITLGVKDYINQSIFSYFGFSRGMMQLPRYVEEPVNAIQISGDLNFGKSITDKTGINMKIGGSKYVGDPIESYSEGVYYYTENDLYDDPFSYENKYISLNLTRQFTVGFQSKIGVFYAGKNYKGTPALTETGDLLNDIRKDSRSEFSFQLSKKYEPDWNFPINLNTYFKFLIRDNGSNDPYFDFQDHLGIFGITISKK